MLSFKHYLALYEDNTSPADPKVKEKLKHLEHIEELIIDDGIAGANRSLTFMNRLLSAASGKSDSSLLANIKIDGSPSLIAGPLPATDRNAGEFFVSTKSGLSPTGKRYTRLNADKIDQENSPGLAEKLKYALQYLPEIGLNAIFQGDLLFTESDIQQAVVDGKQMFVFKPNVITYAVPVNSQAGKEVAQAKIGIVFHTVYEGDSFTEMHATYNPDLSSLKQSPNVWWKSNRIEVAKTLPHSAQDVEQAQKHLQAAASTLKQIDPMFFDVMKKDKKLGEFIKMHINSKVRQGQLINNVDEHTEDLASFIRARYDKEAEKLKTPAGKQKTTATRDTYLKLLQSVRSELVKLFTFFNHITTAKTNILQKLGSLQGMEAFYHENGKYRRTSGEGLVLADAKTNDVLKLVDRLDFSQFNFSQMKDWKK